MVFFTVTLVIGVVPVEPITNTCGVVAEVLVMVRFWVVPPAVFEPSMMVLLFNTLKSTLVREPEMEAVTPVFGLIVSVLIVLEPTTGGITTGHVSLAEL